MDDKDNLKEVYNSVENFTPDESDNDYIVDKQIKTKKQLNDETSARIGQRKIRDEIATDLFDVYKKHFSEKYEKYTTYKKNMGITCIFVLIASVLLLFISILIIINNDIDLTTTIVSIITILVGFLTSFISVIVVIVKHLFPEDEEKNMVELIKIIIETDMKSHIQAHKDFHDKDERHIKDKSLKFENEKDEDME